jgi:hypothetical protein
MQRARLPYLLIPLAALLAIIPLLINGCSCGHDFDFHILNWMEAARQFTHGNLHPHWAYTPAYNAGEPRFVFYPPLSWTIGAILGLLLPWTWTPILYTWLALTASGLALHRLARDFTTPTAALIAAVLYTVNPYMLFTAYERTAYAELLAAAWIPLLLHAILRDNKKGGVTIPRIAIPIALLWLTNAPAAVMACYALALLTLVRIATNNRFAQESSNYRLATNPGAPYLDAATDPDAPYLNSATNPGGPSFAAPSQRVGYSRHARTVVTDTNTKPRPQTSPQLALNTTAGTALGLGLAAFYILPAAYERHYVQIAMAIIPNMRIQDNFLFHHTGDIPHDQVLHTASLLALILIAATVITLTTAYLRTSASKSEATIQDQSEKDQSEKISPSRPKRSEVERPPHLVTARTTFNITSLLTSLAILTVAITLLLTPLTSAIWNHAPELVYLQFPWRLLAILTAVLALTIALTLTPLHLKPAPTTALTLAIAAALTYPAYAVFHQACDEEDTVEARLSLFHSNLGTDPTDEYTPVTADNDSLTHPDPAYWLSTDPNAKAPAGSQPGPAPTHLTLNFPVPEDIILNLRDYPAWHITLNGAPITPHAERDDGLIALPIPAGSSTIDITYTHTLDQTLGDILTVISLTLLLLTHKRNVLPDGPTTRGEGVRTPL